MGDRLTAVAGPFEKVSSLQRRFDNVTRREGEDPSAFRRLEILAVRGFGDIGPQAQTRMVWDRFILEQQSCGMRRHLDTPIREMVDRCRVWESHSEQGRVPPLGTNVHQGQRMMASDSRESCFFTEDPLTTVASPEVEPQIPVSVGSSASVFVGSSAIAREVRPEPGNYSGLPREPGVLPEIGKVLTQIFFSGRTVPSGRVSHMCCSTRESGKGEGASGC